MQRRAKLFRLVLVAFTLAAPLSASANERVYERTLRSTAWVLTRTGSGSGILVDKPRKLVLTNYHVVGDDPDAAVCFPRFIDGRAIAERNQYIANLGEMIIRGRVIERDSKRDLALIELDRVPDDAVSLNLATSSPRPGQLVHSIGNPAMSDALWVYTSGTVRQVYQTAMSFDEAGFIVRARIVETQSPINPGDSGGPVVNDDGELVAVVESQRVNGSLVSMCIDITEVQAFLRGENKTIDARVRNSLEELSLNYEVNRLGIYRVQLPSPEGDGDTQQVFINSETDESASEVVRELWATVVLSDKSSSAIKRLETIGRDVKTGHWKIGRSQGTYFASFVLTVPANSNSTALLDAIETVAEVAHSLIDEITNFEPAAGR